MLNLWDVNQDESQISSHRLFYVVCPEVAGAVGHNV